MTTHKVVFRPVDIEIDVDEDETVLEAAFRQGVMLMHGCKEGQCSACKSYLLDGDLEMLKHSSFALPEFERDQGYVLLCRSHAYSDLEIELLNYDEDTLRSGLPIQAFETTVAAVESLTHDIRRLVLTLPPNERMLFRAGQYVDIQLPGCEATRAYSMANTPADNDHLEFMIKVFPGGRFSELLEGGIKVGQPLHVKGPYGLFMLREQTESDIICIGGGSGLAPLWSLLNDMAQRGIRRNATLFYGARNRRDLFYLDEIAALAKQLPGFKWVPALSMAEPADEWDGETGFITDVLARMVPPGQRDLQAYLCGPPPMIDAAMPILSQLGITNDRIFFDKFTPTGAL
ncbi:MAG: 2Fe-2S iron-sulfur cluster binding domain-containing protein [Herpetosiphon sp.]